MNKVTRRDAIKVFAGAGIALAASPVLLNVAASRPEVAKKESPPNSTLQSSGSGSVVIHLKDGKLVGYRGMQQLVLDDDELVARITQKFQ